MNTISIANVEIKTGNWPLLKEKPTLIFIHGASLSKEFWDYQVDGIKGEANTIAIDLPGHGGSAAPGAETIVDYANVIIKCITQLDIKGNIIPCGMSMGGAIAQQLIIDWPDLFKAAILINTGARLKVLPAIFETVRNDYDSYINSIGIFSISGKSDCNKLAQRIETFSNKCSAETTLGDFAACNTFDVMDRIIETDKPVLVFSAEEDFSTPPKYGKWLADNIKHSKLVHIHDAGHFSPIEKPDEINNEIIRFMKKL